MARTAPTLFQTSYADDRVSVLPIDAIRTAPPAHAVSGTGSATVHIRGLDRNGTSNVTTAVVLINLGDVGASPDPVFMIDGEATAQVEPGFYTVTAAILTAQEGDPDPDIAEVTSVAITTEAELRVDGDTEITLDARDAEPISVVVEGVPTRPMDVNLSIAVQDRRDNPFVVVFNASAQDVIEGKLFVEPTGRVRHGRLEASSKWRLEATGTGAGPTYDLLFAAPQFPDSLQYVLDQAAQRHLAQARTTYRSPVTPIAYQEQRHVFTAMNPVSVAVPQPLPSLSPVTRLEHFSAGRSQEWFQCAAPLADQQKVGDLCSSPTRYRQSARVEEDWLRAPLRTTASVQRGEDSLLIGLNDLAEDAAHSGSIAPHLLGRSFRLFRNGSLLEEGTDPLGVHAIPGGDAAFRLDRTVELQHASLPLSSRVESSWTFNSSPPRRTSVAVPLLDAAIHLPVDDQNRVQGGQPLGFELEAAHTARTAARVAHVSVAFSTDDGATWHELDLRGRGHARYETTLPALPSGTFLSLRTSVTDSRANAFDQTVIRAAAVS